MLTIIVVSELNRNSYDYALLNDQRKLFWENHLFYYSIIVRVWAGCSFKFIAELLTVD